MRTLKWKWMFKSRHHFGICPTPWINLTLQPVFFWHIDWQKDLFLDPVVQALLAFACQCWLYFILLLTFWLEQCGQLTCHLESWHRGVTVLWHVTEWHSQGHDAKCPAKLHACTYHRPLGAQIWNENPPFKWGVEKIIIKVTMCRLLLIFAIAPPRVFILECIKGRSVALNWPWVTSCQRLIHSHFHFLWYSINKPTLPYTPHN